jgi:hypothetical protein
MKALSIVLVSFLCVNLLRGQEPGLHIIVVAGEGVTHNITQIEKKGRYDPVVQVEDENGKPIQGASVVFALPAQGPGGTFENSTQTLVASTDAHGRAVARGIRLNKLTGPFAIRVTASFQGRTANATISETTISAVVRANGPFGVSKKSWVISGLTLLAIGGAVFAFKDLKSNSNSNTITATPGIPVVGGPQ